MRRDSPCSINRLRASKKRPTSVAATCVQPSDDFPAPIRHLRFPQTIPTFRFSILTVANVHVREPSAFNPNHTCPTGRNRTSDSEDRSRQGSNTHQILHRQGTGDDERKCAPSFHPRLHPKQHYSRILRKPLPVPFQTRCNLVSPTLPIRTQPSSCRAADPQARSSKAPCVSFPLWAQKPPHVPEGPSALEAEPYRPRSYPARFGTLKLQSVLRSLQIPIHQLKKIKHSVSPSFSKITSTNHLSTPWFFLSASSS